MNLSLTISVWGGGGVRYSRLMRDDYVQGIRLYMYIVSVMKYKYFGTLYMYII